MMHSPSRAIRRSVRLLFAIGSLLAVLGMGLQPSSMASPSRSSATSPQDWLSYMRGTYRTGYDSAETTVTPKTAPSLKLQWSTTAGSCVGSPGGPTTISTQPIVSQTLQLIFWGSWDGCEYATNLSGTQVWSTYLGQMSVPTCNPPTIGVASTPTLITEQLSGVSTPVILLGGGDANFYALNALTGAIVWKTSLSTGTGSFLWSSPAVYNGSVYEGLASQSDCPLVQGMLYKLNAQTGAIQATFPTVPNGCTGASIWGSPTIDQKANTIYFATGNAGKCTQTEPYSVAVVEVSTASLSYIDSWQVPSAQQVSDSDFGTTPTLFQATINGVAQLMVGLENKNGIYYAFSRGHLGNGPVWQDAVAVGEVYAPSAWNGVRLFVGAGWANISGTSCQGTSHTGSLRAIDPATGTYIWQDCFASGQVQAAITLTPGLAIVGAGNSLRVVASSNGKVLFTYFLTNGGIFFASASVSNGVVYIGDSKGNLYAFAP